MEKGRSIVFIFCCLLGFNGSAAEWLYCKDCSLKDLISFYRQEYQVISTPQLIGCENKKVSNYFYDLDKDFYSDIAKISNLEYKNDIISEPADIIEVLPSLGLSEEWISVFPSEVKTVGDQLVIIGKKTRVNEIKASIQQLSELSFSKVRVLAVYADKRTADDLGVKLTSWLKLSYSYLDVEKKMYNFVAELNEVEDRAINVNMNNEVTLIAGRDFSVFLGSSEQKEIFTVNAETGERLSSGFIDIDKGLTLTLKSFRADKNLLLDVSLKDEANTESEVNSKLEYNSTVQLDNQVNEVLNLNRNSVDETKSSFLGIHKLWDNALFSDKIDSELVFRVYVLKLPTERGADSGAQEL